MVYALIEGPGNGWKPLSVGLGVFGVFALVAFLIVEARKQNPMIPLSIFRSQQFSGANAVTFAVYAALGTVTFLLVVHLQTDLGYSALEAGASLLPITVCMLLLSARAGALAQRIGPRIPMTVGPLVVAVGMVLLGRVEPGTTYWETVFPALIVLGLGLSLTVAPLTATVLGAVEDAHAGIASAINNAVARIAGLLAVAVLPAAAGLTAAQGLDLVDGFSRAMYIAAGTRRRSAVSLRSSPSGGRCSWSRSSARQSGHSLLRRRIAVVAAQSRGMNARRYLLDVVIEIPRGSRNKYEYDHERHVIRLDRRLFSATVYPADYGFVPDTLALDGDPLDVLVLLEDPTFPGCWVEVRAVGVFWMEDEKGPDAKILCVPSHDPIYEDVHDLERAAAAPARRDRALLRRLQDAGAGEELDHPRLRGSRRGVPRDRGVEVAVPELGIGAALRQQLLVAAGLDDPAVVDHHDPVGGAGGLQAVGDQQRGAVARHHAHRPLHPGLGAEVEVGRRLVEQQDRRIHQQGAGQADAAAAAPPTVTGRARSPGGDTRRASRR